MRTMEKYNAGLKIQLCVFLMMVGFSQIVNAQFSGGDGSSGNPYQIATASDLNNVRNYLSSSFILTADIDLNVSPYNSGSGWEPIGGFNPGYRFNGSIDGNDYTISNLYISRSGYDYIGLIGATDRGSSITNLNLTNINVTGSANVGGLIGFNGGTNISFVSISGSVNASSGASGGVTGQSWEATLTNISSTVSVTSSSDHSGGITGNLYISHISDSYSSGTINGYRRVGGMVGTMSSNASITSSVNRSYSTGSVSGSVNTGGLIGYSYASTTSNSFWDTQTSGQSSSAGGTGKTTSEMKNQSTFTNAGWNFGVVWTINSGSYPTLLPPPVFDGGLGTSSDPFHVGSADQLNEVRNYLTAYFIQTEHIDLSSVSNWNPIENFEGSYDGNGRIISNLTINRSSEDNVGLFEIVEEGAILNRIAIENANVTGRNYVGTIAGAIYDDVTNSYSTGSVNAVNHAGGLVGRIEQTEASSIGLERSYSVATVSASSYSAGGLAGRFYDGHIKESYAAGTVTAPNGAGGLVGEYNPSTNYITNSYWDREKTGQSTNSGGGSSKSTLEMLQKENYSGWNFSSNWDIKERDEDGSLSYPFLRDPNPNLVPGLTTNTAPFATNVYINGIHQAGASLVGEYDYYDTDGDSETGTTFRWYRFDDAEGNGKTTISGVSGRVYVVNQYDDNGKYISFEVTVGDQFGQGNVYESSLIGPAPEEPVYGVFDAGAGTEANPYQIATAEQLNEVRNYPSFHFILTANINLDVAPYNSGSGWDPVGTQSSPFTGTFYGDGYIIDGLFIDTEETYVGLFGNTENANIYNIGLTNVDITGEDFVGALIGFQYAGPSRESVIENSYATGVVNSTYSEGGGLIGRMQASGGTNTIRNSYARVQVIGTYGAGGFIGAMNASSSSSTNRIYNSYSTGAVSGNTNVGGFVGQRLGSGQNSTFTSFWDTQTSGRTSSDGGIGETSSNMKSQSTYTSYNWDFTTEWAISGSANNGYPTVKIQSPIAVFPGSGTIEDPYQISNANQLNAVRNYLSANFILVDNVDLDVSPFNSGSGWEPIGTQTEPFRGRFDGNDYTIDGLFINRSTDYTGLFGRTSSAQITNVRLTNIDVTGNVYTGGLIGQQHASSRTSTVSNSYVTGAVDGNTYVGLLVGGQYGEAGANYVQNSFTKGTVETSVRSGGLVGAQIVTGGGLNDVSVSYAATDVQGSIESGGLVGYVEVNSSGTNSVNNSLWDEDVSGQTQSQGGVGVSTSQMKTESTFTNLGWDFSSRWSISSGVNSGYPNLQKDPVFAAGDGTSGNPYQISTATHLNEVRNFLTSHFKLTNDIDVGNFGYNYPQGWDPIGENSSGAEFRGVFDGNGYIIENLRIRRSTENVVGLFGAIFDGEVKNVGLVDVDIEGKDIVGALVGISYSDVKSTFATGQVEGSNHVGGLVGILENYNGSTGDISESYALVDVEAAGSNAGGLVGRLISGTIDETYSAGEVRGSGSNIGGLVGINSSGSVSDSYWDIETSEQSGSALGAGKTSEEMKTQATFSGWNFSSTWALLSGAKLSYPYLRDVDLDSYPGEEKTYENGSGSTGDPYQISSAKELNRVRLNRDSAFVQSADIDLSVFDNWEPIADFGGSYNGSGYSIKGLTINRPGTSNNGLFGSSSGTIYRVGLDSVSIIGAGSTGGLVGFMYGGSVSESYTTGSITGGSYAGGLVGQLLSSTISNSYSLASVDGESNSHIGGFVGIRNNGTIINSYSAGKVTGSGFRTLGFVGYRTGSGTVSGNYWDEETSGYDDSYDATEKTTQEMKTQSTFGGWNFSSVWAIKSGYEGSYPYLRFNEPDELPGYVDLIGYEGEGTVANPYKIKTPLQLHAIRFNMNSHYELVSDINLDVEPYNAGSGWEPIGTNSSGSEFKGVLDGKGYTIKNLFINRGSSDFNGLFGATHNAVLKNISLEDVNITGDQYNGALVGFNYSQVLNSYSTGSVSGYNHTGGLVGATENYNGSNGLVSNSYSTASVSSSNYGASGLVGRLISGTIQNSFAAGIVSAPSGNGGLIGEKNSGTVSNSYWDTQTTGQTTSADGTGLTTAQMWSSSNFSGFDWENHWAKSDSIGYPYLREFGHKKVVLNGDEGWRLMAAPSGKHTVSSVLGSLWTQGFTGSNAPSGTPNVLFWNEATRSWQQPADISDSVSVGSGFATYIFSDDNGPNAHGNVGFPKVLTNSGTQFSGTANPAITFTDSGTLADDGWNLLGNPYGTSINWDASNGWSRTNIDGTFYVWSDSASEGAGAYLSWNGTTGTLEDGKIAPWQGFWVKANAAGASISLNDSVRSFGGTLFKKKQVPQLKLRLSGNEMSNSTVVMFDELALEGKDGLDAYKLNSLNSGFLLLSTVFGEEKPMDIQALPVNGKEFLLELDMKGSALKGDFSLLWDLEGIPDDWEITLIDREEGSKTNISTNSSLEFKLTSTANSKESKKLFEPVSPIQVLSKSKGKSSRFAMLIRQSISVSNEPKVDLPQSVELEQNYPNPFNPSTTIAYGVPETGEVTLEVFDILGRKVATLLNRERKNAGRYSLNFNASNLASGMYIYRLRAGSVVMIKKFTLIK